MVRDSTSSWLTGHHNCSPANSPSRPTPSSPWAAATSARTSPGKRYTDWELEDPKGRPLDDVRAIRDDIYARVQRLVTGLDIAVA